MFYFASSFRLFRFQINHAKQQCVLHTKRWNHGLREYLISKIQYVPGFRRRKISSTLEIWKLWLLLFWNEKFPRKRFALSLLSAFQNFCFETFDGISDNDGCYSSFLLWPCLAVSNFQLKLALRSISWIAEWITQNFEATSHDCNMALISFLPLESVRRDIWRLCFTQSITISFRACKNAVIHGLRSQERLSGTQGLSRHRWHTHDITNPKSMEWVHDPRFWSQ